MTTAHRVSGTTTLQRSARAGRKRGGIPWQSPLTQMVEESILTGFWVAGITRTLEGHIWTRPRCQGALEWKNTLRDRCSHIFGLLVKTSHGLRALMKSALPRLITTTASGALSLRRFGGSRSDRSCHQLDDTSHCAESLLSVPVK